MSVTYKLQRQQLVPLDRTETFRFFENAANLELITPDFLSFQIVTPMPIEMKMGTLIDYRLRLFGISLKWRTQIEEYDPPHRFVDRQIRGPYKSWRHTHLFEQSADGTRMTEIVHYQLPMSFLGKIARILFVRRTLETIFDYRRDQIEKLLLESVCQNQPGNL